MKFVEKIKAKIKKFVEIDEKGAINFCPVSNPAEEEPKKTYKGVLRNIFYDYKSRQVIGSWPPQIDDLKGEDISELEIIIIHYFIYVPEQSHIKSTEIRYPKEKIKTMSTAEITAMINKDIEEQEIRVLNAPELKRIMDGEI